MSAPGSPLEPLDLPPVVRGEGYFRAGHLLRENVREQGFKDGKLPPLNLPEAPCAAAPLPTRKQSMADDKRKGVKWDPTIRLGDVLAIIGFVGGLFSLYNVIDKRVTVLEVRDTQTQQANAAVRQELRDTASIMRDDLKEVRKSVDELTRSLTPRADRR